MRVGTVVAPALVAIAIIACGDSGGGPGDGPRSDGAGGSADARRDVDGMVDGMFDGATRGPITVTVHGGAMGTCAPYYGAYEPCVGQHVVFTGPDGGVVADEVTDSTGRVSAMIESGSALTLVHMPETGAPQLATHFDLQPGDDVFIGEHAFPPAGSFMMQGAYSEPPGATYTTYAVAACAWGDSLDTTALTVTGHCMTRPFDIAVLGFDVEGVGPVSYATAYDVTPVAGGTVTMGPWQELPRFVARVHGVPETIEVFADGPQAIEHGQAGGAIGPSQIRTGSEFEISTWIPPVGDGILVRFLFRGTDVTSHTYLLPRDTTSFEIDYADVELPDATDETYTPATRTVSWQEVGLGIERVNFVVGGLLYGDVEWLTFGPRGTTTEVVFPDLGAGYPSPTSGVVFLLLEAVPGGYAAVRTDPGRRYVRGDPFVLPRLTENHSTH